MKYAIQLRRIEHTANGPVCTEMKLIDRVGSTGLEAPHTTRRKAKAHADAINERNRAKGGSLRADVVPINKTNKTRP